jgi:hypothetical protein
MFDAALEEYKTLTKQDLRIHPLTTIFDGCDTLDAILDVFRGKMHAFDTVHDSGENLTTYLDPTVQVLFMLSTRLGDLVSSSESSVLLYVTFQHLSLSRFLR